MERRIHFKSDALAHFTAFAYFISQCCSFYSTATHFDIKMRASSMCTKTAFCRPASCICHMC